MISFGNALEYAPNKLSRLEYFIRFVFALSVNLVAAVIEVLIMESDQQLGQIVLFGFSALMTIYVVWGHVARFRDIGHSGWLSLLLLIPIFNIFVILYLFFASSNEPKEYVNQ